MPILAINLDGAEPKFMIDENGKLSAPLIAPIESAFGDSNTDWRAKHLESSIWKKKKV